MNTTTFSTIPLDVLRQIFHELTPKDVVRVGMTCRILYLATQDHYSWFLRASVNRARVPMLSHYEPQITSLTTEELKNQAIRRAQVDLRWASASEPHVTYTTFFEDDNIRFASIIPGGDYVLIVLYDGKISLRSVETSPGSTYCMSPVAHSLVDVAEPEYEVDMIETLYTLEHGMLLAISMSTMDDNKYIKVYRVDTCPPAIEAVRSLRIPGLVLAVCAQGEVMACLFAVGRVRYIVVTSIDHSGTTVLKPEMPSGTIGCNLCMPSPQTLIIYGNTYIRIYHVPQIDLTVSRNHIITIAPIWQDMHIHCLREFRPNIQVWDSSSCESPIVHLISDTFVHILTFSRTDNSAHLMVESHVSISLQMPVEGTEYITMFKCQKGIWYYEDPMTSEFVFPTMSLVDPNVFGIIRFHMDQQTRGGSILESMDFDEVSGRLLLVSQSTNDSTDNSRLHVGDVVRVRGRGGYV